MPTLSLRLTEEEHAALKEWAYGNKRSMQREAVFRIFSNLSDRIDHALEPADAQTRDVPARRVTVPQVEDPHFKPDFK
jgi:hypothetical protein